MKKALVNLANNTVLDVVAPSDMYPKLADGSVMLPYPDKNLQWFDCPDADKISLLFDGVAVTPSPAKTAAPPDVSGFVTDLKVAMGGIVSANALAKTYPLFWPALQMGHFADAQALIIDAHATLVLSDVQYGSFKQLAAKYHLPIVLP
jgi:hypothetical protein